MWFQNKISKTFKEWKSRDPLSHKMSLFVACQPPRTLRIRTAIHRAPSPPKILGNVGDLDFVDFMRFQPKSWGIQPKSWGRLLILTKSLYKKKNIFFRVETTSFRIWPQLKKYSQLLRAELEQFWTSCLIVFYFAPGTQMTLVFIGKGLVSEGWCPKIEDKQVQVH